MQFGPNENGQKAVGREFARGSHEPHERKGPCPAEALKVLPAKHWGSQLSVWSIGGSLCSLVSIQLLEDHLL